MDDSKRENLIQALAASMGADDVKSSSGSRYNPDTGTLFCNGVVVSKNSIEEARLFFEKQSQRYASSPEKEVRNMAQLYTIGAEAIKMLQNGDLGADGRDYQVIKK